VATQDAEEPGLYPSGSVGTGDDARRPSQCFKLLAERSAARDAELDRAHVARFAITQRGHEETAEFARDDTIADDDTGQIDYLFDLAPCRFALAWPVGSIEFLGYNAFMTGGHGFFKERPTTSTSTIPVPASTSPVAVSSHLGCIGMTSMIQPAAQASYAIACAAGRIRARSLLNQAVAESSSGTRLLPSALAPVAPDGP